VVAGKELLDEGAIGRPFGRHCHADTRAPGGGLDSQSLAAAVRDAEVHGRTEAHRAAVTAVATPL
jgi:hypothetical protein